MKWKNLELQEWVSIVANVGVIAGIVFLAIELRQNNELLASQTRATYASMDQTGWVMIIENPSLIDILIQDRSGEPLSESQELRLNALWMQTFAQYEFRYLEDPDFTPWVAGQRRIFQSYPSLRRAWRGDGRGSRQAGKDNFDPDFVTFYDEQVAIEP
ncbi:MAG: hypothetical protein AAF351_11600 [Pseudomonadota bacterium]